MITINATGDTTIHTAGKYCPEDILVKVPAGGSGGGSVETCTVTINNVSATPGYCHATSFEDGSNCYKSVYLAPNKNTTITNVLRNTVIVIYQNSIMVPETSYTSNAILKSSNSGLLVFMVGTESSGNCEIVYRDGNHASGGFN